MLDILLVNRHATPTNNMYNKYHKLLPSLYHVEKIMPYIVAYHKKCIDPWLLKNKRTCPVCKRRVVPRRPRHAGSRDSGSSDSEDLEGAGVINERRPLLAPPTGAHDSGDSDEGAAAANYGSTQAGKFHRIARDNADFN